jgi:hypothetical protein
MTMTGGDVAAAATSLALSGPRPPDPAVLAAITAAVELAWPRPAAAAGPDEHDPAHEAWRFSGRWWNKPVPLGRDRPWARGR